MWVACPDCEHVMEVEGTGAVACPSCGFHGDIARPDDTPGGGPDETPNDYGRDGSADGDVRLECPRCTHQTPVPAGADIAKCASCGFSAPVPAAARADAAREKSAKPKQAAAARRPRGAKNRAATTAPAATPAPAAAPTPARAPTPAATRAPAAGAAAAEMHAGDNVWLACPKCRQWIEVEAGGPIQACRHCGARIVPPAPAPR